MTDYNELVKRLRLGGPNATEVSDEAATAISALSARVKELEVGLKPFARLADIALSHCNSAEFVYAKVPKDRGGSVILSIDGLICQDLFTARNLLESKP